MSEFLQYSESPCLTQDTIIKNGKDSYMPLTLLEGDILWYYEMKKCCKKYKKKGKHCKNCPRE